MKPNSFVVIGGGTGSFSLLSGLRNHPVALSSIVTMMDSGGNSGVLRDAYGVLPPGDLRRCLIALSDESQMLRDLFAYRFEEPPLAGHNLGNLFFLALVQTSGSEKLAIEAIARILKIKGRVIPVTWDHAHLNAELDDGEIIVGEANIDLRCSAKSERQTANADRVIKRVFLTPAAAANPDAVAAIAQADILVLAPGDLFTSSIPNLLVDGIAAAIQNTKAPMIYVVNLMTKHGETDGYSASQHIAEIEHYAGRLPDAVVLHDGSVPGHLVNHYHAEQARPVELDIKRIRDLGVKIIWRKDIMATDSLVRHDPDRTAAALINLSATLLHPGCFGPGFANS